MHPARTSRRVIACKVHATFSAREERAERGHLSGREPSMSASRERIGVPGVGGASHVVSSRPGMDRVSAVEKELQALSFG